MAINGLKMGAIYRIKLTSGKWVTAAYVRPVTIHSVGKRTRNHWEFRNLESGRHVFIKSGVKIRECPPEEQVCRWFLNCKHKAEGTMEHPSLGKVPICPRCRRFAEAHSK